MKIKNTSFDQIRVLNIYRCFLSKATDLYERKKYNKSIKYIILATKWMYYFNIVYYDSVIENLIHSISKSIFQNKKENIIPDKDCVIFLDSICTTKCLGVQYLSALMSLGKKIIYIQHNNLTYAKDVRTILDSYPNKKIYTIDSELKYVERAKEIQKIIIENAPGSVILHMTCFDVISLLAISNIGGVVKYNIDLQDHTFWLGRSFIDFDIVFRDYGEKIALEKRGLKESEIIRLPYYPLVKQDSEFCGFPDELPQDAVIFFTGGFPYKMLGKNDIFFNLIDNILSISDNVHLLIATDNSDIIKQKVKECKHNDRIHLIGFRKDIDQVFKHSHVYLSTYPVIGGLMTQYAAANAKPILAYAEENEANVVEGIIDHKFKTNNSQRTIEDFLEYAEKLIKDEVFREAEGRKNKDSMYSESDFTYGLGEVLKNKKTTLQWPHKETPDYEGMIKFYLENENYFCHSGLITSIMALRFNVLKYFFKEKWTVMQLICRRFYKNMRRLIFVQRSLK